MNTTSTQPPSVVVRTAAGRFRACEYSLTVAGAALALYVRTSFPFNPNSIVWLIQAPEAKSEEGLYRSYRVGSRYLPMWVRELVSLVTFNMNNFKKV